ncbi:hypothetical protein [Nostoc sp. DedQUE07]|uniref:hypothetical protein n=1 Tax=Nostoc sp. DedQUE07 TaxID=3075392 RepID=UPI002AD3545E|nr:hypothetical protein [Nostoc sp. DedQUE07]MDZ8131581.1 hypothetical protein [Nostoc sp. DedQUE07]
MSAQLVTLQQFNKILGHSLSTDEFQHYLQQVKFINPKVGKFWQGTDVQPGIYIAIAAPNTKETILRSIDLMITLKRHMRPGTQLFLHTREGQVHLLIPELEGVTLLPNSAIAW